MQEAERKLDKEASLEKQKIFVGGAMYFKIRACNTKSSHSIWSDGIIRHTEIYLATVPESRQAENSV